MRENIDIFTGSGIMSKRVARWDWTPYILGEALRFKEDR